MWPVRKPGVPRGAKNEGNACYTTVLMQSLFALNRRAASAWGHRPFSSLGVGEGDGGDGDATTADDGEDAEDGDDDLSNDDAGHDTDDDSADGGDGDGGGGGDGGDGGGGGGGQGSPSAAPEDFALASPEAVLELLAAAATVREQLALAFAPSGGARGDALDAKRAPFEVLRSLLVRVARLSDVRARLRLRQLLLALRDPRCAAKRSRRRTDELRDARRVAERLVAELHVALPDWQLFSGVCAAEDGSADAPFTMLRVAPRPKQRGAPGVRDVAQLLGGVRLSSAPRALLVAIDRPSADKEPVELGGPGGGGGGALVLGTVGGPDATFALASVLVQRRGRKRDACAVLAPAPDGGWWRVDGGGKQRDNAGSAAAEARELAVVALYERVEPHAPARRVVGAADEARLCAVARALDAHGEQVWRWATDTAPPLRDALDVLRVGADAPSACAALAAAELAPLFARAHVDGAWAAIDGDAHADWLVLPCDYSTDDPKVRHTTNYFLTPDKAAMGASLLARLAMLYTHVTGEPPPYALCPRRGSMQKRFVDLSAQDLYLLLDEDDKAFPCDPPRTPLVGLCGTPDYVAPEVLTWYDETADGLPYDTASDLWSLGVLLFVVLSGTLPFTGDSEEELVAAVSSASFSMAAEPWAHVSEDARGLVRALLVAQPEARLRMSAMLAHPWLREAVGAAQAAVDEARACAVAAAREPAEGAPAGDAPPAAPAPAAPAPAGAPAGELPPARAAALDASGVAAVEEQSAHERGDAPPAGDEAAAAPDASSAADGRARAAAQLGESLAAICARWSVADGARAELEALLMGATAIGVAARARDA
ncbi:hypothetical protein KFE25_007303 [Diacronema lutheri]|uniref:Protein kinase domain-containing protein n=1 Tax=Diacronema lutheri TaxID=2081491 RepID=A0A8J6CG76_DIALT|nr:hypothetical protein KFE25_007303 [Diacronema lutheri]